MPTNHNLRIIMQNEVDSSTIVASSTAGTLTVANLKKDVKSLVHRSVGTDVTYTLTWPEMVAIGGVGLPCHNMTAESEIRITGFDDVDAQLVDTGWVFAAPGSFLGDWDWSAPINANAFAFGGNAKTIVWLDDTYPLAKLVIELRDPTNEAGYIDNARIVAGGWWEPVHNMNWGSQITPNDTSTNERNEAGDDLIDRGIRYDSLTFDLNDMPADDRKRIMSLFRGAGTSQPILVAAIPVSDTDPVLVQDWLIYGRLDNSSVSMQRYALYDSRINLREW